MNECTEVFLGGTVVLRIGVQKEALSYNDTVDITMWIKQLSLTLSGF